MRIISLGRLSVGPLYIFRMNVWEPVKELELLCVCLDFKHIYYLKKLLFLYKLVRINNPVRKACHDVYTVQSFSGIYTLMCYSFDLCSEVDIKSKVLVFSAFNQIFS